MCGDACPLGPVTVLQHSWALTVYKSNPEVRRRSPCNFRLKPYWGKPAVRNFREGGGNTDGSSASRRRLKDPAIIQLCPMLCASSLLDVQISSSVRPEQPVAHMLGSTHARELALISADDRSELVPRSFPRLFPKNPTFSNFALACLSHLLSCSL